MKEKLFDSEAKVMEILWDRGPLSAKEISLIAGDSPSDTALYSSYDNYVLVDNPTATMEGI